MTFKKLLMIPLLAAIPAVTGCGSDCKSICEDRNDCPGVTTKADCDKTCDDAEKQAKDLGCEDQYDDFIDCAGDEDVCKSDSSACSKEAAAMLNCITAYCTAHSTSAACSGD
jgi:hypothetical protein